MIDHTDKNVGLILEVSHGCQYSCSGCTVNKNSSSMPNQDQEKEILDFIEDAERNDSVLSELEIGPTDILSAINRDEILGSQLLKTLANKYNVVTFTAGMTLPDEKEYFRLAQQINALTDESVVRERSFLIPFELIHAENKKYIDLISKNAEILTDNVRASKGQLILQVNFDASLLNQKSVLKKNWSNLFRAVHDINFSKYKTRINITLPHGRTPLGSEASASNFHESLMLMNKYYDEFLVEAGIAGRINHLPYQLLYERHSAEVLWHAGDIYIRPTLNERFTSLTPERIFPKPWTRKNLAAREAELVSEDLEFALNLSDCQSCEYLITCAKRGVHEIMRAANTEKCIMMLPKYGHLIDVFRAREFDKIDWKKYACK